MVPSMFTLSVHVFWELLEHAGEQDSACLEHPNLSSCVYTVSIVNTGHIIACIHSTCIYLGMSHYNNNIFACIIICTIL